jgi:PAS domain S-box-containing protein
MLCELDEAGRIVFVSASVRELIGYSPEQVTGSHYRLWIPTPRHARATDLFEALRSAPIGTAIARQSIELHAAHGRRVVTEASVRSYLGVEGAWRAVASFREVTTKKAPQFAPAAASTQGPATETRDAHPPVKRPLLLDRLQAGVAGLRTRHAGHPIERSLAQLVALLETTHHGPLVDGADRADRLLEATQRMTRVVEHALISDRGEDEWKQWIETRKLVDRMRDRHAGRPEASALALQIDVSRGPAEIFGAEPLLEACVAGLIDWGIERDRLAPTRSITKSLLLSFETQAGAPDAGPSLQISVAWESTAGETSSSGAASATAAATRLTDGESSFEARTPQAIDAELTLAVVADATRLLGGELLGSLPAHQGHVRTIRLPQPAPVDTPANTPADYSI